MSIAAYEDKFHIVSYYAIYLLNSKGERIQLYVKGWNYNLQVLFVHALAKKSSIKFLTM